MAIILQEEKREGSSLMSIIVWLGILASIGAAVYYIFFKNAELVETIVPSTFENTAELARIRLNPDEVIGNPKFQALKPYITPVATKNAGRTNPFSGF